MFYYTDLVTSISASQGNSTAVSVSGLVSSGTLLAPDSPSSTPTGEVCLGPTDSLSVSLIICNVRKGKSMLAEQANCKTDFI